MKLPQKNSLIAILITVAVTIIGQFPGVDNWIASVTGAHEHIVTIVEGVIGILLLFFAGSQVVSAETAPHIDAKPGDKPLGGLK